MSIRVAVADDQALVRAGFLGLLDEADDITIVGEAPDGAAAVALARRARPDGLEATRRIVADPACAAVRVLVLATYELDEYCSRPYGPGPAASSPRTSTPTT